ncbi:MULTISPECIES: acyltransferase family protein [unclassified Xanthomonas]|uniref:acyltransferase family protein n=1 Tax=Xanthomonas sp. LMG 9002 TaxID=1591158 RepID=UPI00136C5690|nr:acyltransferase family protein [Xanthomonas sp. LMG 9002]MXV08681.1 glucan biosynthesis protein [Xanthomonas sp. LMG 9002]
MLATTRPQERYDFLDWLRVIAIFVLFFFHTGMIFVGWGWHIVNSQTIPSLQWPMDIAHRLRMPLLFVVAGAGMWFALQRRSTGQFLQERTKKLLLPLIVGMFLVVPPQIYYERLLHGQWSGRYLDFYLTRVLQLKFYPAGDFGWHHLWFILYLYAYVLLLLPGMLWWRRAARRIAPGTWLFLLGIPLGINEALLKPRFPETHNFVSDWYIFGQYLLLTAYGYFMASMPGVWKWLSDMRRWSLVLGLAAFFLLISLFSLGVIEHDSLIDQVGANVFTWLWMMVFLGYGYRYLSRTNRVLAWAKDASYPVYILHQTIIVILGYYVIQCSWGPWIKYVVILLLSMAACLVLYEGSLRRFAWLRLVFGMREKLPRAGRLSK